MCVPENVCVRHIQREIKIDGEQKRGVEEVCVCVCVEVEDGVVWG